MTTYLVPFDYVLYRITAYSIDRWEEDHPWFRGMCAIGVLYEFVLLDLLVLGTLVSGKDLFKPIPEIVFVIIYAAAIAVSWYRYRKVVPYESLSARWQDESVQTRAKRKWLAIGFILLVMLPPFVLVILKHIYHVV